MTPLPIEAAEPAEAEIRYRMLLACPTPTPPAT
jgi:hypothetical protein